MTAAGDPLSALLAGFETAAVAADQAEATFKREIDHRLVELDRARAFAYRRLRLIAAMAAPVAADDRPAAIQARLNAAFLHIGWSGGEPDATEREVMAALQPVAAAIEDLARPGEAAPPSVPDALAAFEAWYRARFGVDFLAVFEQRAAFRPAIDF